MILFAVGYPTFNDGSPTQPVQSVRTRVLYPKDQLSKQVAMKLLTKELKERWRGRR
jgi:hypothetical protein